MEDVKDGDHEMESLDRFEVLKENIEQFIETSRQIGIMVSDFQPNSQDVLDEKLNMMISHMQDIEKNKSLVQDVTIPMEIFQYIDSGKNPQLYTRDCLEKTLVKNEEVKGKIESYKNFRSCLIDELTKECPEMMVKYHQFKKQSKPQPQEEQN